MNRKKILWLVSWYPNKNDRYDGDFIQRHARAAAIDHDIHVVFVTDALQAEQVETEMNRASGLTEQVIYFRRGQGWIGNIRKQMRWRRLMLRSADDFMARNGKPDCVHVHIPWKAGMIALELKKKYGIPFLVSEHWGIYNNIAEANFTTRPFYIQNFLKTIYTQASHFVSVSKYLATGVNDLVVKKDFSIIENVVDTTLFFCKQEQYETFTFIHVSNMVALKNVKGILDAFHKIQASDADVQLVLVGNRDKEYVDYARHLGLLNKSVFFRGEIGYREVAEEMQRAHCLVLNSHIENAPCVIGEALCCGLPVVATQVGGIPEMVGPANGKLVPPGNPQALAEAMVLVKQEYQGFDRQEIARVATHTYGYAAIAQAFNRLYQMVC